MPAELIDLNDDLNQLVNEGYELSIKEGCVLVSHIPYLTENQKIKYGTLVSPFELSGNTLIKPQNHVIYFQGEYPCTKNGKKITSIQHQSIDQIYGGIKCNYSFSNKPINGYENYYEKFVNYINIISSPAISYDNKITCKTFVAPQTFDSGFLAYYDTNASRAGISGINNKIQGQKIGIIGLGGTGSYILDLVAKTCVGEIHLFDGDKFYEHNAFRAPGAPKRDKIIKQQYKTSYFKSIYKNMHLGIKSHPVFITERNANKYLKDLDFVFMCIDSGIAKKSIINALNKNNIKYIDTGIDIKIVNNSLLGSLRNTFIVNNNNELLKRIPLDNDNDGVYRSNIQTAELNALSATFAVIEWKKLNNIYINNNEKYNLVYNTNDGEIIYED